MPDNDGKVGLAVALIALVLGGVGLAIIAAFSKPRCPNCKTVVKKGTSPCPTCGARLNW